MSAKIKPRDKNSTRLFIVLNVVLLSTILMLAQFYRLYTNTLEHNGKWESTKTQLSKGVMGAHAFLVTQRGLAGGRLDLGAWHGHQELFMDLDGPYGTVSFDFEMEVPAHFVFYFAMEERVWSGIRISNDERFPSSELEVGRHAFLTNVPLNIPPVKGGGHRLKVTRNDRGVAIELDGVELELHHLAVAEFNAVGFRGSGRSVLIDNIQVLRADGSAMITERFNRHLAPVLLFGIAVGLLVVFNLILGFKELRNAVSVLLIAAFIGSGILLIYYQQIGQFRYPKDAKAIRYGGYTPNIQETEDLEHLSPPVDYRPDHALIDTFGMVKDTGSTRILFIGASQTWGAGASTNENAWVAILNEKWNEGCPGRYTCMNAAVSGQASGSLLRFHRYVTRYLKPDICIVNLSFNDRNTEPSVFRSNLEALLDLNAADEIITILIPEISNPETRNELSEERVADNRQIVHQVGEVHGATVVSMQDTMWSMHDHGFLFWDDVHLTDYGQQVYADILSDKLEELIPACR